MPDDSSSEERFNTLWRDHASAVLRYARRRVSEQQADEVVAETFVVAWRRLDEVPEAALPWLFGVARRVSANIRRTDQRRVALHSRLVDEARRDDWVTPAAGAETGQAALVASALKQLPDDDRELLMLLAWDGLTRPEAAAALGCSRSTLAVRLHRARHRLKAAMALLSHEQPALAAPGPPATGHQSAITVPGGIR